MNKDLRKNKSIFNYSFFLKLLYIFFVLYDINFTFSPSFTTARVSIIVLILILITKGKKVHFHGKIINFILVLLFLITCSILQAAFSNDFIQTSRLFFFMFNSVLGAYFIMPFIRDKNELFWLFLIACSIQSVITLYAFFIPSFKLVLEQYVIYGGNFGVDYVYRSVGLSSTSGAALSVVQSIGVIAAGLLIKDNSNASKNKTIIIILGILCFLSIFVIGRTGLWISFLFIGILFGTNYRFILSILGVMIFFYFVDINSILEMTTSNIGNFSAEYFSEWLGDAFTVSNNVTVGAINQMRVPPLTWQTIIGTGKITNIDGTNAAGNDTGYIQTYYSLGLLLTSVFYTSLLLFLLSYLKNLKNKKALYILILITFFVDLKEPMLFKYALPFFVFCVFFMEKKTTISKQIRLKKI